MDIVKVMMMACMIAGVVRDVSSCDPTSVGRGWGYIFVPVGRVCIHRRRFILIVPLLDVDAVETKL